MLEFAADASTTARRRSHRLLFHAAVARRFTLIALVASTLAGCASLPEPPPQKASQALGDSQSTPLGRLVARAAPAGARSGFRTLIAGDEAFDARIALADAAERTLDLQYYIVEDDSSTRELLQHTRAAAARGVRVRMLLDDLNTAGTEARLLQLLDEPNIEIRLFNPFPAGRHSTLTRVLSSLGDIARVNRRMHNKLFAADNMLAITGGRNLGDGYFGRSPSSNFVDLDVLIAGPAVRPLSASFDSFWNNPLAYPARMFITAPPQAEPSTADGAPQAAASAASSATAAAPPASAASSEAPNARTTPPGKLVSNELQGGRLSLVWAPARVLADSPSKLDADAGGGDLGPDADETLVDDMERLLRSAKRDVILISPYFVPGERGMAVMRELRARGVTVQILTNSLAANDAPLVHVGYSRYRTELLKLGVTLAELKPGDIGRAQVRLGSFGSSTARLHAKALVIDHELSLIGSMNFDPRSHALNTEEGVLVRSTIVANQVADFYASIARDASYALSIDGRGDVVWTDPARTDGPPLGDEPGAGTWLRWSLKLLAPFAPEEML